MEQNVKNTSSTIWMYSTVDGALLGIGSFLKAEDTFLVCNCLSVISGNLTRIGCLA